MCVTVGATGSGGGAVVAVVLFEPRRPEPRAARSGAVAGGSWWRSCLALAEEEPPWLLEDAAAAPATTTATRSTTAASLRDGDQPFHTRSNLRDDVRRIRVERGVFAQCWEVCHLLFAHAPWRSFFAIRDAVGAGPPRGRHEQRHDHEEGQHDQAPRVALTVTANGADSPSAKARPETTYCPWTGASSVTGSVRVRVSPTARSNGGWRVERRAAGRVAAHRGRDHHPREGGGALVVHLEHELAVGRARRAPAGSGR